MSVTAEDLYKAWSLHMHGMAACPFHLLPAAEKDAWERCAELNEGHGDDCKCIECDPYGYIAYETLDAQDDD